MNAQTTIAKPARPRLSIASGPKAPAAAPAQEILPPIAGIHVVPTAPQIFALRRLRRAPENVRHTHADEDVDGLAENISHHGLLQSLIGYVDGDLVQIIGGGRRYQALRKIEADGLIDGDFPIPVLIRGVEEAIELSLSENLQQRTMSPVDEFFAFRALMDNPANTPEILAKRFGFAERTVKQRLRMAALDPQILDALAAREITLDVAMAYARTQDQALQLQVFKTEQRRSYNAHRLSNITYALTAKGLKTDDPVARFVGDQAYRAAGGAYEDDLFIETDGDKVLANPALALGLAEQAIAAAWPGFADALRARKDLSPTIDGYVLAPDLRVRSWGNDAAKAPGGMVALHMGYDDAIWKRVRSHDTPVRVLIGIDDKGALAIHQRTAFVAKREGDVLKPPAPPEPAATPEQQQAATRAREIAILQRRLAVGPFTGTPLEGRAHWLSYSNGPRAVVRDGVPGWMVPVDIFVTDEQIAAQADAAAARYERDLAEAAEREKEAERARLEADLRAERLRAMDPPAVALVDGDVWYRQADGSFETDDNGQCENWLQLLDVLGPEEVTATFVTREAFNARDLDA